MRTRTFLLSLGLVLLLLVSGAMAAIARQDGGGPNRATELTLYAEERDFTWISAEGTVNPDEEVPPAPGDRFVAVDDLFSDEDRQDQVGRNDVHCTFTEASGETEEDFEATVVCHGVVTLDDQGTIAWQASASFTEDVGEDEPFVTVGLTGGTGDFLAAGGEVEIFDTTGDDEDEVTSRYEITLLEFRRR